MSMLNRLPKDMPSLKEMMADCGNAKPRDVAKALGVSERTVISWLSVGSAPRPALLALFWMTRWGMQWADVEVFNLAQLHIAMSEALKCELGRAQKEIEEQRRQLERIGRLGDFGSANDPAAGISGPGPVETMRLTFSGFERGIQQVTVRKKRAPTPEQSSVAIPVFTRGAKKRYRAA